MVEIKKRAENWEVYIDGGLYHWSSDLADLLEYVGSHAEDIKCELRA